MTNWYCQINGASYGPAPLETLSAWVIEGRVKRTDLVRSESMPDWSRAGDAIELQAAFERVPPPLPHLARPGRPGGLTALAIINFVFGGLGVIGAISNLAMLGQIAASYRSGPFAGMGTPPTEGALLASSLLSIPVMAMEIAAGFGFLRQRRGMGYIVGNIAAGAQILHCLLAMFILRGMGVMMFSALSGAIYPIVLLILLNTIFRKAFINR